MRQFDESLNMADQPLDEIVRSLSNGSYGYVRDLPPSQQSLFVPFKVEDSDPIIQQYYDKLASDWLEEYRRLGP